MSTLDRPHLIGQAAEKPTPPQPIGRGLPAGPAPLVLRLLSRSHVPRSGSHRHPPAGVGRRHAGGSGGPLQSGQSVLHRQAARASGERVARESEQQLLFGQEIKSSRNTSNVDFMFNLHIEMEPPQRQILPRSHARLLALPYLRFWILTLVSPPAMIATGFLGNSDFRRQPVVSVGRGENRHQAAAGERRQRLDGVPHRTTSLAHGNVICPGVNATPASACLHYQGAQKILSV